MSDTTRRIVHLLPTGVTRGAQAYARAVVEVLDSPSRRHEIVVLFDDEESSGSPGRGRWGLPRPARARGRWPLHPLALVGLRRHVARLGPDLVVAHGSEPFLYAALVVPRRIPILYYRIGISRPELERWWRRLPYRVAARRAHRVMGVSAETLEDSRLVHGVDASRLRLVPNGRHPGAYLAAGRGNRPPGPVRLIWVGHLTAHKRVGWFVQVVERLRADGRQVDGIVVGDGPDRPGLEAAAGTAGVTVLGVRDDVAELLASADVFCFTSEGENEGMPGVLIEAGMAGLPTVATRVAGAAAVVDDGVTGTLVDPSDLDGFTRAVADLVSDPDRRVQMGAAARSRCLSEFTMEVSAARFAAVVEEALSGA